MESIHKKINRVRKPRVHISYEVETEDATLKKELPFVVGVLGDLSADSTAQTKPLKDRRFVQIDGDNFDDVLKNMAPGLTLTVPNELQSDATDMEVSLSFSSMQDFEPEQIVKQVAPLNALLEARNKLRDLASKADRSEALESILEKVLQNEMDLTDLAKALEEQEGEV